MMRIALFLGTNLAVLIVLNLIFTALGLNQPGMNWMPLLIIAGSFISLMMSKSMAKPSTGARVIETPGDDVDRWLL